MVQDASRQKQHVWRLWQVKRWWAAGSTAGLSLASHCLPVSPLPAHCRSRHRSRCWQTGRRWLSWRRRCSSLPCAARSRQAQRRCHQ